MIIFLVTIADRLGLGNVCTEVTRSTGSNSGVLTTPHTSDGSMSTRNNTVDSVCLQRKMKTVQFRGMFVWIINATKKKIYQPFA